MEKETHPEIDMKDDNGFKTLDIHSILNEEKEIDLFDMDIDFLNDNEEKKSEIHESINNKKNIEESDRPQVSIINDEFDQFQEELSIRNKRLKHFVSLRVDNETINELEGMLKDLATIVIFIKFAIDIIISIYKQKICILTP